MAATRTSPGGIPTSRCTYLLYPRPGLVENSSDALPDLVLRLLFQRHSRAAHSALAHVGQSRLRLTCFLCTVDSRAYIVAEQLACDAADFGGQKSGSSDQTASVGTTPLGAAGVVLAFVDTTALTVGLRYRICLDLDGVATTYAFGDSGLQVASGP